MNRTAFYHCTRNKSLKQICSQYLEKNINVLIPAITNLPKNLIKSFNESIINRHTDIHIIITLLSIWPVSNLILNIQDIEIVKVMNFVDTGIINTIEITRNKISHRVFDDIVKQKLFNLFTYLSDVNSLALKFNISFLFPIIMDPLLYHSLISINNGTRFKASMYVNRSNDKTVEPKRKLFISQIIIQNPLKIDTRFLEVITLPSLLSFTIDYRNALTMSQHFLQTVYKLFSECHYLREIVFPYFPHIYMPQKGIITNIFKTLQKLNNLTIWGCSFPNQDILMHIFKCINNTTIIKLRLSHIYICNISFYHLIHNSCLLSIQKLEFVNVVNLSSFIPELCLIIRKNNSLNELILHNNKIQLSDHNILYNTYEKVFSLVKIQIDEYDLRENNDFQELISKCKLLGKRHFSLTK